MQHNEYKCHTEQVNGRDKQPDNKPNDKKADN